MKSVDLLIIGGGSAGMAAAIQAREDGISDILIIEKNSYLGGILKQCIHNGFGITEFKKELTGPEYMSIFASKIEELKIPYRTNSLVTNITKEKEVTYINQKEGQVTLKAKAIIFATGCYERNAGNILLPGDRVSGIVTAGTAQRYLNIDGYLVGKKVVILGSGDIGLIMARRLTLEGAKVMCVVELMPYSNGLNRNIYQCLTDYNIPLYLSTTVSKVVGSSRVEKVILSSVDKNLQIIPGTEKEIECDTLLLSVGLLPNIQLIKNIGGISFIQSRMEVDQNMQTSLEGVFACGNALHVHDVVDFVSEEGRIAGKGASEYIKGNNKTPKYVNVSVSNNISYVIPNKIDLNSSNKVSLKFRVKKPMNDVSIKLVSSNEEILSIRKNAIIPSEMAMINIDTSKIKGDLIINVENIA